MAPSVVGSGRIESGGLAYSCIWTGIGGKDSVESMALGRVMKTVKNQRP